MKNFEERIRDEINKSVNNLEKDIARTYQKKCPKCGNMCADKLKICPACSHTLEGVIRKYQLESRSHGFNVQLKMLGYTILVFISFFLCIGMISLASYLFGAAGFSLTLGIITFFLCYLLFGRIKPVVKEINHADDYMKRINIR